MLRNYAKELLFQLFAVSVTVVTFPAVAALLFMRQGGFAGMYFFLLVMSAPAFYFLGVPLSAAIQQAKRAAFRGRPAAGLAFELTAYAALGAAAMYVYLVTALAGLQLHRAGELDRLLAIGAGAALYLGLANLALSRLRARAKK
ncbi:hypothetical protein [Paenibacillus sp.]|uniref:hypothetical protein n=1 Tax=Paenibacillus sp. TaxID=58172 RepID=UPI002D58CFC8|nr:hypothetical protein [Paenibacillus sp.]HZG86478.1 hypothetical protein [Paenibacillus sp.]